MTIEHKKKFFYTNRLLGFFDVHFSSNVFIIIFCLICLPKRLRKTRVQHDFLLLIWKTKNIFEFKCRYLRIMIIYHFLGLPWRDECIVEHFFVWYFCENTVHQRKLLRVLVEEQPLYYKNYHHVVRLINYMFPSYSVYAVVVVLHRFVCVYSTPYVKWLIEDHWTYQLTKLNDKNIKIHHNIYIIFENNLAKIIGVFNR